MLRMLKKKFQIFEIFYRGCKSDKTKNQRAFQVSLKVFTKCAAHFHSHVFLCRRQFASLTSLHGPSFLFWPHEWQGNYRCWGRKAKAPGGDAALLNLKAIFHIFADAFPQRNLLKIQKVCEVDFTLKICKPLKAACCPNVQLKPKDTNVYLQ